MSDANDKPFSARIYAHGVTRRLGRFSTVEEARAAYQAAKELKDQEEALWKSVALVMRLQTRIDMRGVDECWPWNGRKHEFGYGVMSVKNKPEGAHRLALELIGCVDVPRGLCVCHRCDNPECCNPRHMFLGTVADNNNDRHAKGRSARGERKATKLTEADVEAIRAHKGWLTNQCLAETFGISDGYVRRIQNRELWRHV